MSRHQDIMNTQDEIKEIKMVLKEYPFGYDETLRSIQSSLEEHLEELLKWEE